MDILILAAGYGKRMGDLTKATPKPLLPFKEKNLLSYALEIAEAIPEKIFMLMFTISLIK